MQQLVKQVLGLPKVPDFSGHHTFTHSLGDICLPPVVLPDLGVSGSIGWILDENGK